MALAKICQLKFELLGMGVASRHHCRGPGNAKIGLPQPAPELPRQAVELLDRRVQQLGIGREVMAFGYTVVSTVTRLRSWLRNARASCATRKLSVSNSSSLSPSRLRQWLRSERSCGNAC